MNDPERNQPEQLIPPNNIYPQLLSNRDFLYQYVVPYYFKSREYLDVMFG